MIELNENFLMLFGCNTCLNLARDTKKKNKKDTRALDEMR